MKVKVYKLTGGIEENIALIKEVMAKQLYEGARDPGVRRIAEGVLNKYGIKGGDELGEIRAMTAWVRSKTRYTKDPYGAELLRHPKRLIAEYQESGQMLADCDESATLLASLLGSVGHNSRLALIDANPLSKELSHAVCQVEYNGGWLWIDTTRDMPIGKVVPHSREVFIE